MSASTAVLALAERARPRRWPGPVRVGWRRGHPDAGLIGKEWLITNGLGGYASGTLAGMPDAPVPRPAGRVAARAARAHADAEPPGRDAAARATAPSCR